MKKETKFDEGWACIDIAEECFEYMSDLEDEETYSSGLLIIEDGKLIDYDGMWALPMVIIQLLEAAGINCDEIKSTLNEKI